jgi:chromosome segregation ATPase
LEYNCKIINKTCPFIKEIKQEEIRQFENSLTEYRQNIEKLLKKKDQLEKEIEALEKQIKEIQKQILLVDQDETIKQQILEELSHQKQQILQEIESLAYDKKLAAFNKAKQDLQAQIEKKRQLVKDLKYNLFKQIYSQLLDYEKKLKNIEQQTSQFEKVKNQIDNLKQQYASLEAQIEKNKKFIAELQNQKTILLNQKKQIVSQINQLDIEKVRKLLESLQQFEKKYIQWQKLYDDYKQSQIEVEKLKEEKKIVTDLYNIFSKELMLMILEGFLPNLFEIINSNLTKVVDFELKFELKKTNS